MKEFPNLLEAATVPRANAYGSVEDGDPELALERNETDLPKHLGDLDLTGCLKKFLTWRTPAVLVACIVLVTVVASLTLNQAGPPDVESGPLSLKLEITARSTITQGPTEGATIATTEIDQMENIHLGTTSKLSTTTESPTSTLPAPKECKLLSYDITQFELYTRDEPERPQRVDTCLLCSHNATTVILVHGFRADENSTVSAIRHQIFRGMSSVDNVIYVNWEKASRKNPLLYQHVVSNVLPQVDDHVLQLLLALTGMGCQNIGIVGHSLGAHIAGNSARLLANQTGIRVKHIFGLDPAGPEYDTYIQFDFFFSIGFSYGGGSVSLKEIEAGVSVSGGPSHRFLYEGLRTSSAQSVIVLHTDRDYFGIDKNIGHTDINVHGGRSQPDCESSIWFFGWIITWWNNRWDGCSHSNAIKHFNEFVAGGQILKYL